MNKKRACRGDGPQMWGEVSRHPAAPTPDDRFYVKASIRSTPTPTIAGLSGNIA
jgi:hypothetical protein